MKLPVLAVTALALTLGLASEASADYSAKVDKDTLNIVGDGASDKLTLYLDSTTRWSTWARTARSTSPSTVRRSRPCP